MGSSLWLPVQARDVNLDIKRVVAYRHWCNKLWNAVRFALLNLGEGFLPAAPAAPDQAAASAPEQQQQQEPLACRWILSRLDTATEATVRGLETYAFAAATQARLMSAPLCALILAGCIHQTHTAQVQGACTCRAEARGTNKSKALLAGGRLPAAVAAGLVTHQQPFKALACVCRTICLVCS